jgi:hypothetical protein
MSFMLTAISVSYTIKIQLKVMASTKQTSSSSHQKETCSCQDIVDKLTPCQDIADKLTPLTLNITHSHKVTTISSLIS